MDPGLQGQTTPTFSQAEFQRRRQALLEKAAESECEAILVYGSNRTGSAIGWLTNWPVSREAAVIFTGEDPHVLLVQHYNHVPNARRIAIAPDVRWGGPSTIETAISILHERGARRRVAFIGPLGYKAHIKLKENFGDVVDLNADYTGLRLIKSDEEVDCLRAAAGLTDRSISALSEAPIGTDENGLVDLIERSYVPFGGRTHIHYLGLTSMRDPDRCVPSQHPGGRKLKEGDVLTVEISAALSEYAGQILRTFTIGSEPTPLYADLHRAAETAFDAIAAAIRPGAPVQAAVDASSVIEEAGFTIYDDLLHGFGGGYLPPIVGSASRQLTEVPDMIFEAGMTVVIQPNVITRDERAGVQTGELVLITGSGVERLHRAERGLLRIG